MRIIVSGVEYPITRLTLGEGVAFEKLTGTKATSLVDEGVQSFLQLQTLVFIAMKRKNPTMRFSETENIAFEDVDLELDPGEAPEESEGEAAPLVAEESEGESPES